MSQLSHYQQPCSFGFQADFANNSFGCSMMSQQSFIESQNNTLDTTACSQSQSKLESKNCFLKDKRNTMGDRFIPFRNTKRMEVGSYLLNSQENSICTEDDSYSKLITEGLIKTPVKNDENVHSNLKINHYKQYFNRPSTLSDQINCIYDKTIRNIEIKKPPRCLPQNPERILDAPELVNDYYLNLLDWGNNNVLAVSLGQSVYLWNAANLEIQQLLSTGDEESYISSVSWSTRSSVLAVGTSTNTIQVWDTEKGQPMRTLYGHDQRISSLNWNGCVLSSGSRDSTIMNHDLRMANHVINRYIQHNSEVCGLKWSPDGSQLASGSNDNTLMIWDISYTSPRHVLREHTAAVKALAWCPWQKNLLASGGGTNDKTIKFWNTDVGGLVQSINANTQVCSLIWNPNDKEILSSHGFSNNSEDSSKSYIRLYKYPTMNVIGELKGHEDRVLHLALSPDNETVVSAGADERLCFWKLFEAPYTEKKYNKGKVFMSDFR